MSTEGKKQFIYPYCGTDLFDDVGETSFSMKSKLALASCMDKKSFNYDKKSNNIVQIYKY